MNVYRMSHCELWAAPNFSDACADYLHKTGEPPDDPSPARLSRSDLESSEVYLCENELGCTPHECERISGRCPNTATLADLLANHGDEVGPLFLSEP